jgi:hypothetical protein
LLTAFSFFFPFAFPLVLFDDDMIVSRTSYFSWQSLGTCPVCFVCAGFFVLKSRAMEILTEIPIF